MYCVKTGAHVWLSQYGEWVYGDAFETDDAGLVLQIVYAGREPARPLAHYRVDILDHWFGPRNPTGEHMSVLFVEFAGWQSLGTDGVPITQVKEEREITLK